MVTVTDKVRGKRNPSDLIVILQKMVYTFKERKMLFGMNFHKNL